jgi:hypothetical protein
MPAKSISLRTIFVLASHLRLGLPFRVPHQNYVCTSAVPIRATCPAHLALLASIIRMTFGEQRNQKSPHCGTLI